jgi:hypothetical protein
MVCRIKDEPVAAFGRLGIVTGRRQERERRGPCPAAPYTPYRTSTALGSQRPGAASPKDLPAKIDPWSRLVPNGRRMIGAEPSFGRATTGSRGTRHRRHHWPNSEPNATFPRIPQCDIIP